jgi:hypothetical protein
MKLYATVAGIREVNGIQTVVSKGQGSNDVLAIHLTGEDRNNDFAVVTVWPDKTISINKRDDVTVHVETWGETKGKK